MLRLLRLLNEHLLMQIIAVVAYKHLSLLEKMHDIDALIELLRRQVRRHDSDAKFVLGKLPHILIGAEIMR